MIWKVLHRTQVVDAGSLLELAEPRENSVAEHRNWYFSLSNCTLDDLHCFWELQCWPQFGIVCNTTTCSYKKMSFIGEDMIHCYTTKKVI